MKKPTFILLIIVVAQFCGTSLWFAGNAALPTLQHTYHWPATALGYLISSVQVGFIVGTFLFAWLGVADRFHPSRLFFVSCVAGALTNLLPWLAPSSFYWMLASRLGVGLALAGIYPVGMKLAADWQEHGLGNWLGWLVGALVVGTALPHLLKASSVFSHASILLLCVSILAAVGGALVLRCVPAGPFRVQGNNFSFHNVLTAFANRSFRKAALGYFGHMWELYAFWAFLPFMIQYYNTVNGITIHPLWLFVVIALGGVSSWWGGWWSKKVGSERVALYALALSGGCCLVSPLIWNVSPLLFLGCLCLWSMAVIADSPQFSTLVARHASPSVRGSALTMVTCIGFSITIVSIQLLNGLADVMPTYLFWLLAPGPMLGVAYLLKK